MRVICGRKTLIKFQTFEGSQYFSPDLRRNDGFFIRVQREVE